MGGCAVRCNFMRLIPDHAHSLMAMFMNGIAKCERRINRMQMSVLKQLRKVLRQQLMQCGQQLPPNVSVSLVYLPVERFVPRGTQVFPPKTLPSQSFIYPSLSLNYLHCPSSLFCLYQFMFQRPHNEVHSSSFPPLSHFHFLLFYFFLFDKNNTHALLSPLHW